ncbi:unnamed protein product [Notodromas monacha]|uniref:Uncharacterized protein n=1 Tax=Notodromas monacha TaxID=399045 RepID=A0A7R9BXI9_9CRUS|nr:unnamed protein product [Notodromas monacha]CAG0921952.1 unnamed protein product [Notodromas monacha]
MAELWKECMRWLIDCKVLPDDHRVTQPSAQVIDLALTLRDGLVLCRLASNLDSSAINLKDVSPRPQTSQFLCVKNIKLFLTACREHFGLTDRELFEPHMLYDLSRFGQVLITLSALSKTAQARSKNIAPFPIVSRGPVDDSIYKNLDEVADHHFPPNHTGRLDSAYDRLRIHFDHTGAVYTSDREEDVYEDICYITFKQTELHEDVVYRRQLDIRASFAEAYYERIEDIYDVICSYSKKNEIPSVTQTPLNKRDHCMKELVETENSYVMALRMLKQHFMKPLSDVLPVAKRDVIFLKIKDLIEIHTGFYSQLCQACQDEADAISPPGSLKHTRANSFDVPSRISDVFLRWKEKFVVYGDFIENLTRAQETIDDLCASEPSIKIEIAKCEMAAEQGKFRLRDLLTVPMQRVLKYHLLLDQLIKNTSSDHDDYDGLRNAHSAFLDLNEYLNEVKRDSDDLQAVQDILLNIEGDNIQAHGGACDPKKFGRHVKEGELKVLFHDNPPKKNRYIFVFDKVLLICKASRVSGTLLFSFLIRMTDGEQYVCKDLLQLSDYKVDETPKDGSKKGDGKGNWTWSWHLVQRVDNTAITMYAKTEQERKHWLAALKGLVERMNPAEARRAGHCFSVATTTPGTNCKFCRLLMKGLVYQGYQCSVCSIVVHKDCLEKLTLYCGRPEPPPRREESLISSSVSLPPPRPLNGPPLPSPRTPLGVEEDLHGYDWFQGRMSRPEATQRLSAKYVPPGTFMVRLSMDRPDIAISVKDEERVRHMRVAIKDEAGFPIGTQDRRYYLANAHFFRSMKELIEWYKDHSLCESFVELDITLQRTYFDILNSVTEVTSNYSYEPGDDGGGDDVKSNVLCLKAGAQVSVLDKKYDNQGWWLVHAQHQTGYFPKSHLSQKPSVA